MEIISDRSDLDDTHFHPLDVVAGVREGIISRDLGIELLAELPLSPAIPDGTPIVEAHRLCLEIPNWNNLRSFVGEGGVDPTDYEAAYALRAMWGLAVF